MILRLSQISGFSNPLEDVKNTLGEIAYICQDAETF